MWRPQHLLLLLALACVVASQTVLPGYAHSVKLRKSPYYVLFWSVANETLRVGVVAETKRGYVAIGWGPKDHGHLESDIVVAEGNPPTLTDRWSTDESEEGVRSDKVQNINVVSAQQTSKEMIFEFTRPMAASESHDKPICDCYMPLQGRFTKVVWAVGSEGGDRKRQRGSELDNHGKGNRGWGLINFRTGKHHIKEYAPISRDWWNVIFAFGILFTFLLGTRLILPWDRLWFLRRVYHIPYVMWFTPYDIIFFLMWYVAVAVFAYLLHSKGVLAADFVGIALYMQLAFLMLPIAKNSVWFVLFGISFERAIKYHRWIALMSLLMMTVHGALYMWEWGLEKSYPIILTKSYVILRNWTGLFALLLAAIIGITSFILIRRKKYELFYWSHFLFVFWFAAAVAHDFWIGAYMGVSIFLYCIDTGMRLSHLCKETQVVELVRHKNCTELRMRQHGFTFHAGQYLYLHIGSVGRLQLHPLTISSCPADNYISVHVRTGAEGTWSAAVADMQRHPRTVRIDGAYGSANHVRSSNVALMCAAGSGATPYVSILRDVLLNPNPTVKWYDFNHKYVPGCPSTLIFVWVVRDADELDWFKDTIELAAAHGEFGKKIQIRLFITGQNQQLPEKYPFARLGRPDWDGIVRELKETFPGERSIPVHACGPAPMQEMISAACYKYSSCGQVFDYHPETFSF